MAQRQLKQQQLQRNSQEQRHFGELKPNIKGSNKYYNENEEAEASHNSNNNNNNIDYNAYLQQQRQQRLQNGLLSVAEPQFRNGLTKANRRRETALMEIQQKQDGDEAAVERENNSDLNEIFGSFQHEKYTTKSAKNKDSDGAELRETNEIESAINYHQPELMRRSTPPSSSDIADEEELNLELPYGIQNVRKRQVRHNADHIKPIAYQSLCPTKRIAIPLETSGYEYRPSQYIEVSCAHHTPAHSYEFRRNRICSEAGFSCIQLNRTIHLIRRKKATTDECWESEIRIVPSGCECMWPKHDNGDIAAYHKTPKRFGGYANVQANADYEQGEGYRQIRPQQVELFGINGLHRDEENDGVGFEAFEYN
ncbi:PREDICTED: uncharacterized protein LOC108372078 [Rhagoletis zephyria]|uniref:uncharacterized protein LOC108372078 n=1 Tax=Rhagoletis zephyria TaxID=28612 RepID=UPI000811736B|nr:PREDICTED: uncharacterized protein LOC108372078 [Rhagoletis zephyria]